MNTPTPRTDAAWAQTFDANGFLSGRGNAASQMRDECATLERELTALTAERDQLRAENATLRAQIGTPPEGSHPDEQIPRAGTWHQERLNWIIEVQASRAYIAKCEVELAALIASGIPCLKRKARK